MAGIPAASIEGPRLEAEIRSVGTALSEREASASGSALRGLDERAMRYASRDQELRAAMFRFVDVTPACRNLDDLGEHLAGLVGSSRSDRRASGGDADAHTKAGRMALGAARWRAAFAHGAPVRCRRLAARRWAELSALWRSRDRLDTISSVRPLSRPDEADATGIAAPGDRRARRRWPSAGRAPPGARADSHSSDRAREPLGEGLGPDARDAAAGPGGGARDAEARLRPVAREARRCGAHLHIDMEAVDSLESTLRLVLELLGEPEFRHGPSVGLVLQAYLRDSPCRARPHPRLGARERAVLAARDPARQGRLLGPRGARRRGSGGGRCPSSPTRRVRPQLRDAHPPPARRPPTVRVAVASHNLRSIAHAIAYDRLAGAEDRDLELQVLRGLGDDLAGRSPPAGLRVRVYCRRSATWSPAWPIWCAGCSRTPRTSRSCPRDSRARSSKRCWPHRELGFEWREHQ